MLVMQKSWFDSPHPFDKDQKNFQTVHLSLQDLFYQEIWNNTKFANQSAPNNRNSNIVQVTKIAGMMSQIQDSDENLELQNRMALSVLRINELSEKSAVPNDHE